MRSDVTTRMQAGLEPISSPRQFDLDAIERVAVGSRPDRGATIVALGDLANEGETQTAALRRASPLSPLERLEGVSDICGQESCAMIGNGKPHAGRRGGDFDVDRGVAMTGGVLDQVADQTTQQARVARYAEW